jgi:prepilin-type N-terminal cleavage/methylation domain-containing protein/prepilin-type processing-associated H-X9-DG protein
MTTSKRIADSHPPGFTIVELLVAISIIAVLLAITLPAIQGARERSRRMQCEARLKQFGLAIQAFEGTHGTYPTAQRVTKSQPMVTSGHAYAPHVFLLPYLDAQTLARKIDTSREQTYVRDPARLDETARTELPVFLCPSDSGVRGNSYRYCTGTGPGSFESPITPGGDGVFLLLKTYRAAEIRDGISSTIAMAEKLRSTGNLGVFGPEDYWYSGVFEVTGAIPEADEMVTVCASLSGKPSVWQPHVGGTWYLTAYDYTLYNHAVTPNSRVIDCSTQLFYDTARSGDGVFKASSRHTGGVNCVFLDGHTRFVNDQIDLAVWRAVGTRAGAESIGASEL